MPLLKLTDKLIIVFFVILVSVTLLIPKISKASTINEYQVPAFFFVSNWNRWQELENKITYSLADIVVLDWQGHGGRVDLGNKFIRFLHSTNKHVILKITGANYSMHSLVFCAAPNTEFKVGFLMFHLSANDSTGEVNLDQWSQRENHHYMVPCIAKGIVTESDIQEVNKDRILYVYSKGSKNFTRDTRR